MSKMIYKKGNMYKIKEGMVDYKIVPDEEVAQHLESGWYLNPVECLKEPEGKSENREYLEIEAKALGVSFNSRTSDETLIERIEAVKAEG